MKNMVNDTGGSRQRDDLPLHAIPSVRDRPRSRPETVPYVAVGAGLFGLIVVLSFLAAPYIKVPAESDNLTRESVAVVPRANPALDPASRGQGSSIQPPETQRPETQRPETQRPETQRPDTQRPDTQRPDTQRPDTQRTDTQRPDSQDLGSIPIAAPSPARVEPARVEPASLPPATPAPPDRRDEALASLRRDLSAKEAALLEAQQALDKERKERKSDRSKLEKSVTEARTAHQELATQTAALRQRIVGIEQEASAEKARLAEKESRIRELEAELDSARARASGVRSELNSKTEQHQRDLAAESDAVRQLLKQVEDYRRQLASERQARQAAEARATEAARPAPILTAQEHAPAPTRTTESVVPQRVKTVPPVYPDDLRQARIGGRVVLRLLVDSWGNVQDVAIHESPHPRLSDAAKRAAEGWKYEPARDDGLRTSMWVTEAVDFKL